MKKESYNEYYGMVRTQMDSKIIPLNIYGAFERAAYLCGKTKEECAAVAKKELIETHYFIKKALYDDKTVDIDRKIMFHINAIANSAMVQFYNTNHILRLLGFSAYENCKLTVEDLYKTTCYWVKRLFKTGSHYDYKKKINEYFLLINENVIKWMSEKYRDLYYVMDRIQFDAISLFKTENNEERTKNYYTKMKIYEYGNTSRDVGYDKVRTYDGQWKLYLIPEEKDMIHRWYAADNKGCVKWLKEQLSPYFVPKIGYDVYGEKVGLRHFFVALSKFNSLNEVEPATDFEIKLFKDIIENNFSKQAKKMWGDQSEAKEYIEKHYDKNGNFIDENGKVHSYEEKTYNDEPISLEEELESNPIMRELYEFQLSLDKEREQRNQVAMIEERTKEQPISKGTIVVHDIDSYLRLKELYSDNDYIIELQLEQKKKEPEEGSPEWWAALANL